MASYAIPTPNAVPTPTAMANPQHPTQPLNITGTERMGTMLYYQKNDEGQISTQRVLGVAITKLLAQRFYHLRVAIREYQMRYQRSGLPWPTESQVLRRHFHSAEIIDTMDDGGIIPLPHYFDLEGRYVGPWGSLNFTWAQRAPQVQQAPQAQPGPVLAAMQQPVSGPQDPLVPPVQQPSWEEDPYHIPELPGDDPFEEETEPYVFSALPFTAQEAPPQPSAEQITHIDRRLIMKDSPLISYNDPFEETGPNVSSDMSTTAQELIVIPDDENVVQNGAETQTEANFSFAMITPDPVQGEQTVQSPFTPAELSLLKERVKYISHRISSDSERFRWWASFKEAKCSHQVAYCREHWPSNEEAWNNVKLVSQHWTTFTATRMTCLVWKRMYDERESDEAWERFRVEGMRKLKKEKDEEIAREHEFAKGILARKRKQSRQEAKERKNGGEKRKRQRTETSPIPDIAPSVEAESDEDSDSEDEEVGDKDDSFEKEMMLQLTSALEDDNTHPLQVDEEDTSEKELMLQFTSALEDDNTQPPQNEGDTYNSEDDLDYVFKDAVGEDADNPEDDFDYLFEEQRCPTTASR